MLLELSIDKYFVNREKCELFDGYATTLISIYGCGKCGTGLIVHKVHFKLQEQVKTTKTDKTRFFVLHPPNSCSLMSHVNPPIIGKKNCAWTTKYKKLFEMCIVQNVEMKTVFTFQPIKRLGYMTVRKPAATF